MKLFRVYRTRLVQQEEYVVVNGRTIKEAREEADRVFPHVRTPDLHRTLPPRRVSVDEHVVGHVQIVEQPGCPWEPGRVEKCG